MAAATADADSKFMISPGPDSTKRYPVKVIYCPVCDDWPLEYCEYHPNYEKAKDWAAENNLTEELEKVHISGDGEEEEGKKKRQTRGGKGVVKMKKKQEKEKRVYMSRAPRGKKKFVTVVGGLGTFDIDLKTASKFFASRFSCGSSVTGEDEVVIQGDVKDDLYDILPEKWTEIDEDCIEDRGDMKRS